MIWSSWARKRVVDGRDMFGVMSGGVFFAMADAAQAGEFEEGMWVDRQVL